MSAEPKPFADWIGRTTESEDDITPRLVDSFRAIFDPHLAPVGDGVAPLGIHWCLSPAIASMDQLGRDGHPAKNLSLPPVPLPRRMWAGGELQVLGDLRVGDRVLRTSTIRDVTHKQGRSGELWFVAVGHEYSTDRGLAVRERHDIVYREEARPGNGRKDAGRGAEPPADGPVDGPVDGLTVETPETLLFRYSAITFNGHRIHYDLPYATEVEGYEGLVVHGPIQATLLLNLAAASGGSVPSLFAYRGLSPAIAGRRIAGRRGTGDLANTYWTEGASGVRHMEASVG